MAAVRWALGARQELGTLIIQVGRYSPTYAASLAGRVLAAVERLEDFPRSGRIVPDYQDDAVRELLIDSYRLVYLFEFDEVEVVAILHGSQDMGARLGDDPEESRLILINAAITLRAIAARHGEAIPVLLRAPKGAPGLV